MDFSGSISPTNWMHSNAAADRSAKLKAGDFLSFLARNSFRFPFRMRIAFRLPFGDHHPLAPWKCLLSIGNFRLHGDSCSVVQIETSSCRIYSRKEGTGIPAFLARAEFSSGVEGPGKWKIFHCNLRSRDILCPCRLQN